MRNHFKLAILIIATISPFTVSASYYEITEVLTGGTYPDTGKQRTDTVQAFFFGTSPYNDIIDITSTPSVYVNGEPFPISTGIYVYSLTPSGQPQVGGAQVSWDGFQNDFIFSTLTPDQMKGLVSPIPLFDMFFDETGYMQVYNEAGPGSYSQHLTEENATGLWISNGNSYSVGGTPAGSFSYSIVILPIPEPSSIALLASGIFGFVASRRKAIQA